MSSEVRSKLFAGDISAAGAVLGRSFRYADGVAGWGDINQFGSYQTLGDLIVDFDENPEVRVTSPSGHEQGDGKTIENTVDGSSGTKWCVNNGSTPVVWQMRLPKPHAMESYSFTSGDDMPGRDPQSWMLEGSADGKTWSELDRRKLDKPFDKRHQTMTFQVAHPRPSRFYRFTFAPTPVGTFQIAEIALAGIAKTVNAAAADCSDYRRDLNLMAGVAHTQYRRNGVNFARDLVVSGPDEVIALHLKADKPRRDLLYGRARSQAGCGHACRG